MLSQLGFGSSLSGSRPRARPRRFGTGASAAAASASAAASQAPRRGLTGDPRDRLVAHGGRPAGRPELERRRRLLRPGTLLLAFDFLLPPVIEHGRNRIGRTASLSGNLQGKSIRTLPTAPPSHGVVRGRGIREREPMHRQSGQRADRDRLAHAVDRRTQRGTRDRVHEHEAQREVRRHQRAHRNLGRRLVGGVGDDHRVRRDDREVELEVRPQSQLDDPRHTVRCEGADLLRGIVVAVVDDRVGARRARQLRLLGARDRRGHARARPLRELDRRVPDRARAAGDEHVGARRSARPRAGSGTPSAPGCPATRRARTTRRRAAPPARGHDAELRRRPPLALPGGEVDPHALAHPRRVHARRPRRRSRPRRPAPGPGTRTRTSPVVPARDFQSVGFTPATAIRTRTSPGPGDGVETSSTDRTSEPPVER